MKKTDPNSPASLFIGRWQPFHDGHKKLIETVLKQGKPVVIGIRDTEISKKNPYTVTERWTKIQQELGEYGELVKIITLPDIDEVCYGREVGYLLRRIQLDEETEQISGTKVRAKTITDHPIIWFTGQSGSGKTTLANALQAQIGGVVLDGDEMRQSISLNAGFSQEDRHAHNMRVTRLAKVLSRDNPVIVSVIAPYADTRKEIEKLIDPIWIHVKRKQPKQTHKPYEAPKKPAVVLDTDKQSLEENMEKLMKIKQIKKLAQSH